MAALRRIPEKRSARLAVAVGEGPSDRQPPRVVDAAGDEGGSPRARDVREHAAAADGDAGKALAYLKERVWMMDYGLLRKNGYYIGSGMIESACKTLVAARCKLAGMHWRHKNAAGIALLRATLRSNFRIAV